MPVERSDAGQVPGEVEVAAQSVAIEVVGGPLTEHLVGDVGLTDAHVPCLRGISSDVHA